MEEFVDLFVGHFLSLWGEASSFLFNKLEGGADILFVGNDCWVNSSHVLFLPSENFHILFYEVDKRVSNVFGEIGSDVGEVFRLIVKLH